MFPQMDTGGAETAETQWGHWQTSSCFHSNKTSWENVCSAADVLLLLLLTSKKCSKSQLTVFCWSFFRSPLAFAAQCHSVALNYVTHPDTCCCNDMVGTEKKNQKTECSALQRRSEPWQSASCEMDKPQRSFSALKAQIWQFYLFKIEVYDKTDTGATFFLIWTSCSFEATTRCEKVSLDW